MSVTNFMMHYIPHCYYYCTKNLRRHVSIIVFVSKTLSTIEKLHSNSELIACLVLVMIAVKFNPKRTSIHVKAVPSH